MCATVEVCVCFWRVTAWADVVAANEHVDFRWENIRSIFYGPCVEPSWGAVAVLFVEGPRYGVGVSLGSKFPTPPLSRGVAVEVKSCGTVDVSCDEVAIASDCPWLSYFAGCRRYVIGIGEALFG